MHVFCMAKSIIYHSATTLNWQDDGICTYFKNYVRAASSEASFLASTRM